MGCLTKEVALSAPARREMVLLPELGEAVYVYVREMTGAERDAYTQSLYVVGKGGRVSTRLDDQTARLVALTAVDDDGNNIFDESEVKALSLRSGSGWMGRVADVARRLSGLTEEAADDAEKK